MAGDKDLAALQVSLELQTAAFEQGVRQVDRQLKRMEKNTKRSSRGFANLEKSLKRLGKSFAGLAAGLSVGALARASKEAIEYGDNIAKTAQKVGVTAAELQELRFAAGQSGIEVRTLDMALQRFARRMGEAAAGTGELLKTTQALGIEFTDSDGRFYSTTELLTQFGDAIGKAGTQQEKLRLAFKAFDSEGAALVNLLGEGSAEMIKLREEAVALGLVMSNDLTVVSEGLNDALGILTTQLKTSLSSALITATYRFANFFGLLKNQSEVTRIAFLSSEISRLGEEIRQLSTGEMLGGPIYIRERASYIAKYAVELNKLRTELGITAENAGGNAATFDRLAQAQARLNAEVEKLVTSVNPLNALAKELGVIDAALKSVTDPATREALFDLREKIEFGEEVDTTTDALLAFNNEVMRLLKETDSTEAMNDLAAALGAIDEAIKRATDPAQIERLMQMREALEFGEILDPEKIDSDLEVIKRTIDGFARDFTNTIVDGLETGEMAFDDFAKNVLKTIVKMMLNDLFTQFFEIIYGGIKTYFGFGTAAPTTGTTGLTRAASLAAPTESMARAGETANTAMAGTVVARASASPSKAAPVTVNVNNYGNDDVAINERQDSNGGISIDVLIKSKVQAGFANGDFDKSLSSAFGLRRMGY